MIGFKFNQAPTNTLRAIRQHYFVILNISIIVISSILAIGAILVTAIAPTIELDIRLLVIDLILIIIASLNLYLAPKTRLEQLWLVMISILTILAVPAALQPEPYYAAFFMLSLIAVITTTALGNRLTILLVSSVLFVSWLYALFILQQSDSNLLLMQLAVVTGIATIFLGVIIRLFVSVTHEATDATQRTTDLLEASASLGQAMSRVLDPNELIQRAVYLIQERFAFYHVQVFLVDPDRQYANLVASTGDIGKQLLERKHRLAIGSESVIGQVTLTGQPIIASNTTQDGIHAFNELLPNTRSELAIPIMDSNTIIGALDVQSLRINAFSQTDVQALRVMASQLATAIRNAELFEVQNASLKENQKLYQQAEQNLQEIQRLNQQLTQQVWDDYLGEQENIQSIQIADGRLQNHTDWTNTMLEALNQKKHIIQKEGEQQTIAVPIELRDEVIGVVEIVAEQNEEDILQVMQAVSEQLAIRLDNARLFEETRNATLREQTLNEIVAGYQASDNIDQLLHITLQELGKSLGAEQTMIRIGTMTEADSDHSKNGLNGVSK